MIFLKEPMDSRQRIGMSKQISFHKVVVEGKKDLLKRSVRLARREHFDADRYKEQFVFSLTCKGNKSTK